MTATADNCLLTAYPFVAQHRTDFQIVTEQGQTLRGRNSSVTSKDSNGNVGEAIMIPVESPSRPSTQRSTSTSSRFGATTSTYEESSESITGKFNMSLCVLYEHSIVLKCFIHEYNEFE